MLAMDVLCAASQVDINVLHLVQSLAKGLLKPQHNTKGEQQQPERLQQQQQLPQKKPREVQFPPSAEPEIRVTTLDSGVDASVGEQGNKPDLPHRKVTTRFKLPGSEKDSSIHSKINPESMRGSKMIRTMGAQQQRVTTTLNILGMQPAFKEPYPESLAATVQQTIMESECTEGKSEEGDGKEEAGLYPGFPFKEGFGMDYQQLTRSPDSVRTQSLIENESIPEILPSGSSSNTSVDLGESITSLESESAGILAISSPGLKSGTSKTLELGLLVSTPGLITGSSQELKSRISKTPGPVSIPELMVASSPGLTTGTSKTSEFGGGSASNEVSKEEAISGAYIKEGEEEDLIAGARSTGKRKSREKKRVSLDDGASFFADQETRGSLVGHSLIEEKLETLGSPLDEAIDRVGLLDDRFQYFRPRQQGKHLGFSGRSVTLSLPGRNVETRCTHYTHSTAALSGDGGMPGSQVPPSTIYKHSVYSIPLTIESENEESAVFGNVSKFENWPSEVALAYTLNMASIVIYGRLSLIQKMALEGLDPRAAQQYTLLQLSEFANETPASKCGELMYSVLDGCNLREPFQYPICIIVFILAVLQS